MEPSQKAIDYLIANPDTSDFFNDKFGAGSAEKILADLASQEKKPLPVSEQVKRALVLTTRSVEPTWIGAQVGSLVCPLGTFSVSLAVPAG